MKRTEFIEQLRDLLREVDQDEKEEALQYYEDYLEEAGILENTEVPETFGTPQRVAQTVRNGLNGRFEQEVEFTERGFQEFEEQKNLVDSFGGIVKSENQTYQEQERRYQQERDNKMGIAKILLILVVGMVGVPIVAPILATIAVFLLSGIIGIGALIIVGASLLLTGGILSGLGLVKLIAAPFAGLVLIGTGFICLAFGLLGMIVGIQVTRKLLPKIIRMVSDLYKKTFQRKRERSV